jgi:hypothetical protein
MKNYPDNPAKVMDRINMMFWIMFAAAVLFYGAVYNYFNGRVELIENIETQSILKYIVIFVSLAGIPIVYMFFRRKIVQIDRARPLHEKLIEYRSFFIIKLALLEGMVLFSLIVYLTSKIDDVLYLTGAVLLVFLINRPTPERVSGEMGLTREETEQLRIG